jgi:glutaredoxin
MTLPARTAAFRPRLRLGVSAIVFALALPLPALALFKVVGPDGKVTYTDRPPVDQTARVTPLGKDSTPASAGVTALPAELRDAVARYPVTLYSAPDCNVCDEARRSLQTRGVPYSERRVENNEDTLALERITGARTVPALAIGAQVLRGWNNVDWASYLDAAGYPKESKLPRGWPAASVSPLTARTAPATADAAPPPTRPPAAPPPDAPAQAPGSIRF